MPYSARKHRFKWLVQKIPGTWKTARRGKGEYNTRTQRFLDVGMLARALLGPRGGGTLERLCDTLHTHTRKLSRKDHGAPITPEYIGYALGDVQATWECYKELRSLYRHHGVSKLMSDIYSEASLGKGYFEDICIPPFMQQHPYFPKEVIGRFIVTFLGGRCEVRIRLQPCDIIHCDFKSQYPTVNALMRLQDLLLAERIELRENAPETRQFLEAVTLADLQRKETWPRLHGIAKVRPRGDILPIRAAYGNALNPNIGLCEVVTSRHDTYYTFADVIASKLLTGKCPEILETIELIPHGRVKTRPWTLFSDPNYTIDLSTEDLFTRLIDLRDEVKAKGNNAKRLGDQVQADYCDKLQEAIKLLANSTSYGSLVEYIVEQRAEERACIVYTDSGEPLRRKEQVVERPGRYFAGPVGTLIPAAGRLLLAIAETLGLARGIRHVFCDTDSMCFARPEAMSWTTFADRVRDLTEWFTPLSPYAKPGSIFQIEHSADERLRCYAVAAKRHALYRKNDDGSITPVKISSHGMGSFRDPDDYRSIYPDAPPARRKDARDYPGKTMDEIARSEAAVQIVYDIWREAIEAIEAESRFQPSDLISIASTISSKPE